MIKFKKNSNFLLEKNKNLFYSYPICPNNCIIPFQIRLPKNEYNLSVLKLYIQNTNQLIDLTNFVNFDIEYNNDYFYIIFYEYLNNFLLPCGLWQFQLLIDNSFFYSNYFNVIKNVDVTTLYYCNENHTIEEIALPNLKYSLHFNLNSIIQTPYIKEVAIEKINGQKFIELLVVGKKYTLKKFLSAEFAEDLKKVLEYKNFYFKQNNVIYELFERPAVSIELDDNGIYECAFEIIFDVKEITNVKESVVLYSNVFVDVEENVLIDNENDELSY